MNSLSSKQSRSSGLDLTRCVAVFFVLSVHFPFRIYFYDVPMVGGQMFALCAARWIFFSCVPLFMLLSGFLMKEKKPEASFYKKFLRVLFEYLVICVVCNLFRIFFLGEEISPVHWITSILRFTAAPYAWYINFYLGLFLLIPFLNLMYRGLTTKGQKHLLLGVLILLTAIPEMVNGVVKLFPDWWVAIYPFTYYFIGCYIAEYRPRPSRKLCFLGVALLALAQAALSFWVAGGGKFNWSAPHDYGALPTVPLSTLLFLALYDITLPRALSKPAAWVSDCALSIFLVSWVFDTIFYSRLEAAVPQVVDRIPYYPVVVPAVFLCSLACASVVCAARRIVFAHRGKKSLN